MSARDADPSAARAPAYGAARTAQLRAVGTAFLRLRPRVVAPGVATAVAALLFSPAPRAQVVAVGGTALSMFTLFVFEAVRMRRAQVTEAALFASLCATLGGITVLCALTGGIASPLSPLLFAPSVTAFAAFGRGARGGAVFAGSLLLVALLALLPAGVPFPPVPRAHALVIAAGATAVSLTLLRASVAGLSDAYRAAGESLDRMRVEALESAVARARDLEAVGARVAHEIKNPLAAVKGLAQLLARSAEDDRARRRLEVIDGEVARMEAILADYLSFSRPLDALRPEPVELRALCDDALAVLEASAQAAGVSLACEGGPAMVRADARRLKEALLNVLANAVQSCGVGGSVRVAVEALGATARVTVTDTGRGMSADELARLGTAFYTTRKGGTGLGVVLARAVARQHGGELSYESEPGRGTRATVTLPADD